MRRRSTAAAKAEANRRLPGLGQGVDKPRKGERFRRRNRHGLSPTTGGTAFRAGDALARGLGIRDGRLDKAVIDCGERWQEFVQTHRPVGHASPDVNRLSIDTERNADIRGSWGLVGAAIHG